jgi:hypothetical protein
MSVSLTVGSRWEGLLSQRVVGRKTNFPILLGVGVGESHFSDIVGNRSKVAFLTLLEVESGSGKSFFACWELLGVRWNLCWVESRISHIVGS